MVALVVLVIVVVVVEVTTNSLIPIYHYLREHDFSLTYSNNVWLVRREESVSCVRSDPVNER